MVKTFRGQALVEYGLVLALIAVAAIVALGVLGGGVSTILSFIASNVAGA